MIVIPQTRRIERARRRQALCSGAPAALAAGTSYAAAAGGGPWNPSTPGNLLAWYKADIGVTDIGGGSVSQWTDQSGNGNTLFQGNAGARPVVSATGWNGTNPTITFNGTNQFFENSGGPLSSYLNGTNKNVTVVATMRLSDNAAAAFQFFACFRDSPTQTNPIAYDFALASGKHTHEFRNNATNVGGVIGCSERFNRIMWAAGGGAATSYLDDVLETNAAGFTTSVSGHNSFLIGTSHLGNFYIVMKLSEIAIYGAKLTLADQQEYLAYSLAKWGGLGSPVVYNSTAISPEISAAGATQNILGGTPVTNEIVVAHVTVTNGSTSVITPPAGEGWTLAARGDDGANSGCSCAVYWKRWGAGFTDNTSVAFAGTIGNMRLVLTRLRGCKTFGNPFTTAASASGGGAGTGTTLTAPTTIGGAQHRVMRFYSGSANASSGLADVIARTYGGAPYGFSTGVDGFCCAGDLSQDTTPVGTATATANTTLANGWAAVTVAFAAT